MITYITVIKDKGLDNLEGFQIEISDDSKILLNRFSLEI